MEEEKLVSDQTSKSINSNAHYINFYLNRKVLRI